MLYRPIHNTRAANRVSDRFEAQRMSMKIAKEEREKKMMGNQ